MRREPGAAGGAVVWGYRLKHAPLSPSPTPTGACHSPPLHRPTTARPPHTHPSLPQTPCPKRPPPISLTASKTPALSPLCPLQFPLPPPQNNTALSTHRWTCSALSLIVYLLGSCWPENLFVDAKCSSCLQTTTGPPQASLYFRGH